MPYTNGVGITYDNGEYENGMDAALALADWQGFAARKAESRARGMLRGIGFANYIEATGGFPRERAEVTVAPEGRVELVLGTMNSGQGHETSFAAVAHRVAGRAVRQRRFRRARYRPRHGRRRLAFRPLDADREPRHRHAHPTRSSRKAARSPRTCWK